MEYLDNATLKARLLDVVRAVNDHVVVKGTSLHQVMDDAVDAKKGMSRCMLFAPVAALANEHELSTKCKGIIDPPRPGKASRPVS